MKNIKHIILTLAFISTISLSSCSDFMDITPTDQYTEEAVFNDAELAQAFVNQVYSFVQHGAKEHTTTSLTDDGYFTHDYNQIAVNGSNVSESNIEWYDRDECPFKWKNRYKGIRYANSIINNIDKVPEKAGFSTEQMRGEAHFLRAYLYTELVRGFGGVPLIKDAMPMDDMEAMTLPRSNMKECLEFIVKDCEEAEKYLPETVSDANLGRATKYAATALKARILLHVASPLYADRTVNTLACNQYDGDRAALYSAAKEAADKVINSGLYELIDCRGGINTERAVKWNKIIITNNKEQIWTHQFGNLKDTEWNNLPLQHGPNGYYNWSGITPTHDFVMAFEMEDGTIPSGMVNVGDHQVGNPYNGREPRFYATIGSDGNEWGRPRDVGDPASLDPTPLGRLQCGVYEMTDGEKITINLPNSPSITINGYHGMDTRNGPIEKWNGSWTGYYERKLIDTSVNGRFYPQLAPWTYIRLAEIYLIAAEACIELNKLDEAVKYIDALRNRIEIKDTKAALIAQGKSFTQEDMREFVRHERRVELAYEESRYYDIRRWMIAPQTNNKQITGIQVVGLLKPGKTATKPYIHNEDVWDYNYYVIDLSFREARKWDNKMYFAPIKREEMRRNQNLVQNPGM